MRPKSSRELAAAYDQWYGQWASTELDNALFPWQEDALRMAGDAIRGASVIDIGCGAGRLTRELVLRGACEVVGTDVSELAVGIARRRAVGLGGSACFKQADMESMPWPSKSFDVAFCCDAIEHVLHPAKALSEVRRVLVPGGTLVLTTPNYFSLLGLHRLSYRVRGRRYTEGGQPVNNLTMWPRTMWWLRRAGFTVKRVQLSRQCNPRPSAVRTLRSGFLGCSGPFGPASVFRAERRLDVDSRHVLRYRRARTPTSRS